MRSGTRPETQRRTANVRREEGFTLIEILIAVTLMSVGVAATMRVFGAAGRTTVRAQQQQVAVQQAQAEVDRLAALPYGELALTSAPPSSSNPLDPGHKVSGSNFAVRSDLTEALVLAPGPGATAEVEPGAGRFRRRHRWRDDRRGPPPLRHLARRGLPAAALRGPAEHQAPDRRGDARPAARNCRPVAGVGLDPRGGPRHRAARVPGAARWRPGGRRPGHGRLVLPLRHSLRTEHAPAPDRQPLHA